MSYQEVKVMIIDDSALVRKVLKEIINNIPGMRVASIAKDPIQAVEKIKKEKPDVITLDLQMPRMDGLTFLKRLMSSKPIPVVVISSLSKKGSKDTMKALELGAVDFVTKPSLGISSGLKELKAEIERKLMTASRVNLRNVKKNIKKRNKLSNS